MLFSTTGFEAGRKKSKVSLQERKPNAHGYEIEEGLEN